MKKTKLALLLLPFASLILTGCGEGGGDPTGTTTGTTHPTGFTPELSEIDEAVKTLKETLSAQNVTFKMHIDSVVPEHHTINDEVRELDGNKIHITSATITDDTPMESEMYYEKGETNYVYQYDGVKWNKMAVPYELVTDPTRATYGFEEAMTKFKQSYTKPSEGVYLIENFSYNVSVATILATAGEDITGYTLLKETIEVHQVYMKITISDGKLVSYEQKGYALTFPKDEVHKTIDAIEMLDYVSTTKIYDFEKIGSTVVTLPVVS